MHFHRMAMINRNSFWHERRGFANPVATIILVPLISTHSCWVNILERCYVNLDCSLRWVSFCNYLLLGLNLKKSRTLILKLLN